MSDIEPYILVSLLAAGLGIVFGITMEWSRFCLLSGVREQVTTGASFKLGMYLLALAVAAAGAQGLQLAGLVDLDQSIYRSGSLSVGGLVVGGLIFGFGAALTRGCVSRLTVLSATGNLRALVVLLAVGISAYATLRGILYFPRDVLQSATSMTPPVATFDGALAALGLGETAARMIPVLIVALVAFVYALRTVRSPVHWFAAIVIGLVITGGWYVTGYIGADEFDPQPVESLTFTAPIGDSLLYLMTYTGSAIKFGIALIAGTLTGSFISALFGKRLALQGFEAPRQLARYLTGGAMMGFGGVAALGCSIGQGLTGVSTLSIASLVALASIVSGMALGIRLVDARGGVNEMGGEAFPVSI
ncbi:MAG: YeeE/YedE family protein [Tepidamorphaceae bacterium]|nr:YeeE/YedE family protein [Rhodobiaceae bacterium]MCC0050010.1 YeeE/YedE family protein [Rhodobiaceae bacterium]